MAFAIAQICQSDDYGFSCVRLIFCSIYAYLVFLIALYSIFKTLSTQKRFCYEILPMITCCLQAILHITFYLLFAINQLIILTNYIQITTFTFVAQSFANLYYRLIMNDQQKYKKFYRKYLIIICTLYTIICVLILFSTIKTQSDDCDEYFKIGLILVLVDISLTALMATYYSIRLVNYINKQSTHQTSNISIMWASRKADPKMLRKINSISDGWLGPNKSGIGKQTIPEHKLSHNSSDQLLPKSKNISLTEREPQQLQSIRKQIKIITICVVIITIFYMVLIPNYFLKSNRQICQPELIDNDVGSNILFIVISIFQITPCLVIPYVFYYLPEAPGNLDEITEEDNVIISNPTHKESQILNSTDEFIRQLIQNRSNQQF